MAEILLKVALNTKNKIKSSPVKVLLVIEEEYISSGNLKIERLKSQIL
jgi:hypothetical protein